MFRPAVPLLAVALFPRAALAIAHLAIALQSHPRRAGAWPVCQIVRSAFADCIPVLDLIS